MSGTIDTKPSESLQSKNVMSGVVHTRWSDHEMVGHWKGSSILHRISVHFPPFCGPKNKLSRPEMMIDECMVQRLEQRWTRRSDVRQAKHLSEKAWSNMGRRLCQAMGSARLHRKAFLVVLNM